MKNLDFTEIARLVECKQGTSLEALARVFTPLAEGWMIFDALGSPVNKICGIGLGRELSEASSMGSSRSSLSAELSRRSS